MPPTTAFAPTIATSLAPRDRIATLLYRWETGVIDKYDFYAETMNHRPSLIAEVTGIKKSVIEDRRRYLRQLAKQSLAS